MNNHTHSYDTAKNIAAYFFLPRWIDRVRDMTPRFGLIAYLMALVFEAIKLIPSGHPILKSETIKNGRIRDVLGLAAHNLHGGLKNVDQYIIFGVFLVGIVLVILQFIFLLSAIVFSTAQAAPTSNFHFLGLFVTEYTGTDIAHLMLDKVFGIPGFYNSCFDTVFNAANSTAIPPAKAVCEGYFATTTFPTPFQQGMQALFKFYSMGMLAVAGFILVYYIFVLMAETVNTGIPFGKRFQSIYSPIRLVIAVLLMLPLAYGYNTGQYVVLLAAKYGSGLATNAWLTFNKKVGKNPMGMENQELVAQPKIQNIDSVLNFMYLVHSCRAAYELGTNVFIKPYLIRTANGPSTTVVLTPTMDFSSIRNFYNQADVKITFGEFNTSYSSYPGGVKPYCGTITMPALSKKVKGIEDIYNAYFKMVNDLWNNPNVKDYGMKTACNTKFKDHYMCGIIPYSFSVGWDNPTDTIAGQSFYKDVRLQAQATYNALMANVINIVRTTDNDGFLMDEKTLKTGWGGAGLWFNKVTAFNGALADSLSALPTPTQYPYVMERVAAKRKICTDSKKNTDAKMRYSITMPQGGTCTDMTSMLQDGELGGGPAQNTKVAELLDTVYQQVQFSEGTTKPKEATTDSKIKNFVTLLFGQSGLFEFRANANVFPLAKLAMFGKEIISKTVIMIASSTLLSGAGGFLGIEMGQLGGIISEFSPAIKSFAVIGVSIGVLLYYVLPLIPFIYFFFAVGRWVKSIFEAMVAIPLWALAHMRLGGDTEGLPGPAALQGYFLVLEIFLRPILTLFGLMASTATFMALTAVMDSIFNLVVMNVGGYDMSKLSAGLPDSYANVAMDGIDALFYTVLYAIFVYTIATSSFKMIDLFPNAIMRWAGTNTSSFNDQTEPMDQVEYNLIYKSDATARSLLTTSDNFDDVMRQRQGTGGKI